MLYVCPYIRNLPNFQVRLIASVPGYHTGTSLKKWGHMKLRNVLQDYTFDKEFRKSPLVYQVDRTLLPLIDSGIELYVYFTRSIFL